MNTMTRLLVIACLALSFTACKKEEAPKAEVAAPLSAPTTDDAAAWRAYVNDVAGRHMDGVNNNPFGYILPSEKAEGFGGLYQRLLEKLEEDLGRGIQEGNMLVFGSPAQEKTTKMVETAFKQVPPGSMKGVKVIFVGSPILGERVKTAVEPAGVKYIFVEAK